MVACTWLTACGARQPIEAPPDPIASTSAGPAGGPRTIAFVFPQSDEFFIRIRQRLEHLADDGSTRLVVVNTNNDLAVESAKVDELLGRKVDAIIIRPLQPDSGSVKTLQKIKAAGVPLICYDNCTGDAATTALVDGVVQTDGTSLGRLTGQAAVPYIKQRLGGKPMIGIVNCDFIDVCLKRKAGFKAALQRAGIKATYVADTPGWLADNATSAASTMIEQHPDLDLLWAANEGGTVGAVAAASARGRHIPVFGTDITSSLAQNLLTENGVLQATTGQDPVDLGTKMWGQASTAVDGGSNDPFDQRVVGVLFTRTNPQRAKDYLSG